MAEQIVELNPGESKLIPFEAIPNEARTYQVSVDGLTGSFVATRITPSAYLRTLQSSLAELGYNLETWGPSDEVWFYVPGVGIQGMDWSTYELIKSLMVIEAINIGMISSAGEVYYSEHHMYYTDGTRIV